MSGRGAAAAGVVAALATIALLAADARAQRAGNAARKPAPPAAAAACHDPLTGTWRAKVFRADSGAAGVWDRVTLRVNRHGAQLSGWIVVESWDGDAEQVEPPRCPDGSPARERWRERLGGTFRAGAVDVRGTRVVKLDDVCSPGGDAGSYNLDHFTGARAPDADLLITTNDDGHVDQGRPHHFQRISCRP